jgi:ABC-2 type transport system ATP-binding protein
VSEPAFELRNVSVKYGAITVLDRVSLELAAGCRHALLGPNGSGKTTLLRALSGRIDVASGDVRCSGVNLRAAAPRLSPDLRHLTQHFSLYGELTVRENLRFSASIRGVSNPLPAIDSALRDFDLLAMANQRAQTLSGGIRQRLMLASVLLGDPQLLLLDEPTAALDQSARRHFWQWLDHKRTSATTLIVTTHLDDDVEHCDTITRLHDGHIESHLQITRNFDSIAAHATHR